MRCFCRGACLIAALLISSAPAMAQFMASDLIYIPVVAHNEGVEGSVWRTDLYITNVDEVAVDVSLFFFPAGLVNNAGYLSRSFGAGGREEEGFAYLDERLADIAPDGTVVIPDVVGEYWLEDFASSASLGAIAVFAYEAGTLDAPDGRVYRNVVAQTRTYNETTVWEPDPENEGEFIEVETTYGQGIPGVPWQNLADSEAINDLGDFTFFVLQGAEANEVNRYNLGLFNTSDVQTSVSLVINPIQADGTPFLTESGDPKAFFVTLPPLSNTQYTNVLMNVFGIEEASGAMLEVSFVGWTSSGPDPVPTFTAYGSLVDGTSNDPTTFLPSFAFPYNVDCMWPGPSDPEGETKTASGGSSDRGAQQRRPLDLPER